MKIVYALILFLVIDYVYIKSGIVPYFETVNAIQGRPMKPKLEGFLAYILMAYSVVYLAKNEYQAAILAFCIYGIFNMTNYTMFDDWSLKVSVLDTLWGTLLFCLVKYIIDKL